jgi:hypothetical protein
VNRTELRHVIETAFARTPPPGDAFTDISATTDDEGIVEYFRSTGWNGHRVRDLRYHVDALAFFTDGAFRYWLPAFMLAELVAPDEADVIAEYIAGQFASRVTGPPRLRSFTSAELDAVAAFIRDCELRYGNGEFAAAVTAIEAERGGRSDDDDPGHGRRESCLPQRC